jgi:hypothetical protein
LASLIVLLAAAALGLLSGAMLLIGVAVVPFWVSLQPSEFARWFREYSPLLGRFMLPLGVCATALAIVAALITRAACPPAFPWFAAATVLAIAVAAIYPIYFTTANTALAGTSLRANEITAELVRWRTWHWVRTGLGTLSFLSALQGLARFSS